MAEYKVGNIVKGMVSGIETYGAFINFDEYYSGLIHISEISDNFVKNINDFIKVGDEVYVKIIGIDEDTCHLNLSIKNVKYKIKPRKKRRKIVETRLGFKTLAYKLPIWIEENLQKDQKIK